MTLLGNGMLLSVVIPTKNRSQYLSDLLETLFMQKVGTIDWEIIVVDNASTDDTHQLVEEKINKSPIPLRYVYEPNPGLHQCRHRGTREAIGEIIAFLDDDTILSPEWISGIDLILSQKADAVVSKILPKWEVPPPKWLSKLIINGKFSYLTLLDLEDDPKQIDPLLVWGASFFIRRSLIYEIGGFHPDGMPPELIKFRGDGELGFFRKFKHHGYIAWYEPNSIAYHRVSSKRMSLEYLCQRSFNEGISDSYTKIREDHCLYPDELTVPIEKKPKTLAYFIHRSKNMSFVDWKGSIKCRLDYLRRCLLPTQRERIMRKLLNAHHTGWKFHQAAVDADPSLLAFILKEDYLV